MQDLVFAALSVAYPFVVFFSLGVIEPRYIAIVLLILCGTRYLATSRNDSDALLSPYVPWAFLLLTTFALVVVAGNSGVALLYYPVLVNFVMFVLFGASLRFPPTVIERIARLQDPELPPSGVAYTRKVTIAWVVFFLLNGSIALGTALLGDVAVWSLYNGLVAYLLMGMLFVGELTIRRRVRGA